MKIGTNKESIVLLLEAFPNLRDSDTALIAAVWNLQLDLKCIDTDKMTLDEFFNYLITGNLENSETITRCRRKIQQEVPSLRGNYYHKRQAHQKQIKQEIKNWANDEN